jgi:two-component system KDP operon response regulator KdpE
MIAAERLLLVDDDPSLRPAILTALLQNGYDAVAVSDGIQAAQRLRSEAFDLVLLDLGLPFVDGWEILSLLETRPLPSVIVISARDAEGDKVRALDLGADDYLTKPFGADELLARVRAVLRRAHPSSAFRESVHSGGVHVDLAAHVVSRDGVEVVLTPTEWALLATLAENAGVVMQHRALLARVWGPEYIGDRPYLRTFIQRLRRKLEADPANPDVIITVGRLGYRFGPMAKASDRS